MKAGTSTTPPASGTLSASRSHSGAEEMRPSSSRSHWMALPALNTLPSRAYVVFPPTVQAAEVTSPARETTGSAPTFISVKQPVP